MKNTEFNIDLTLRIIETYEKRKQNEKIFKNSIALIPFSEHSTILFVFPRFTLFATHRVLVCSLFSVCVFSVFSLCVTLECLVEIN